MGRISYEMDNPSPISQEDLYQKVRTAAKASLDIQVDFLEWSRGFVTTWSTDGCAAEPQHLQSRLRDPDRYGIKADVDVGYLRKINDCWTVGSFLINPTPFGKRAYQMFRGALREQGLSPGNDDGRILTPLIL